MAIGALPYALDRTQLDVAPNVSYLMRPTSITATLASGQAFDGVDAVDRLALLKYPWETNPALRDWVDVKLGIPFPKGVYTFSFTDNLPVVSRWSGAAEVQTMIAVIYLLAITTKTADSDIYSDDAIWDSVAIPAWGLLRYDPPTGGRYLSRTRLHAYLVNQADFSTPRMSLTVNMPGFKCLGVLAQPAKWSGVSTGGEDNDAAYAVIQRSGGAWWVITGV